MNVHPPTALAQRIAGLAELWRRTQGDERVRIAVLDGPVDRAHPCFAGARFEAPDGSPRPKFVTSASAPYGRMSAHGTHVSSVIFGQPGSAIPGVAPACRGILIPIFSDETNRPTPQHELASAINRAIDAGAQIVNISGGELSDSDGADPMLQQAIRNCADRNVLVVAAAGNDACQCLHVPAALPTVLAVGAADDFGRPLAMSNWGEAYRFQGLLAPGENIPGAVPGGGTALKTGTSFSTPIVSGVAALLLSLQLQRDSPLDPRAVREALLAGATRCREDRVGDCRRFMVGTLNVPGACAKLFSGEADMSDKTLAAAAADASFSDQAVPGDLGVVAAEGCAAEPAAAAVECGADVSSAGRQAEGAAPRHPVFRQPLPSAQSHSSPGASHSAIRASEECGCGGAKFSRQPVYALGVIGYDFGTEARRDSFKQLMPHVRPDPIEGLIPEVPGDPNALDPTYPIYPPNPYDAKQMVNYLCGYPRPMPPFPCEGGFPRIPFDGGFDPPTSRHGMAFPPTGEKPVGYLDHPADLSEATQLIWTLNIELTPIYAIRPAGSFSEQTYLRLVQALAGQVRSRMDPYYVSRVSIPGVLTGETVRLFSGQIVPVVEPQPRGMYAWNETYLVEQAMKSRGFAAHAEPQLPSEVSAEGKVELLQTQKFRNSLLNFLNKVYYKLRNLGQSPADRALNYAATNAFQFTQIIEDEAANNTQLDTIEVERSAFCRMGSNCWDVLIRFFDPDNVLRARTVYRFTIDVSDVFPVSVGEFRKWADAG